MAIDQIEDKESLKDELDVEWFEREYLECFVDLSEKMERPEVLLSIGIYSYAGNNYPVPVMTAGEFSCISAPSKSKKSYLKSAFAAAYIGGKSLNYFEDIKGHRKEDFYIIDCDTEQSKFYASNTFARVEKITGQKYEHYYPFKMRHLTPDKRVAFIDNLLRSTRFEEKVKIVFIDGVADLIEDSNDLVMSNYIAQKLLSWTDKYNIHVCIIIHNAYNTIKPTGHLGSSVVKKAESVILLEPEEENKEILKVSHLYSRGRSFQEFYFRINDQDALPYQCDEYGNIASSFINFEKYVPLGNSNDAFDAPENIDPPVEDDVPF